MKKSTAKSKLTVDFLWLLTDSFIRGIIHVSLLFLKVFTEFFILIVAIIVLLLFVVPKRIMGAFVHGFFIVFIQNRSPPFL